MFFSLAQLLNHIFLSVSISSSVVDHIGKKKQHDISFIFTLTALRHRCSLVNMKRFKNCFRNCLRVCFFLIAACVFNGEFFLVNGLAQNQPVVLFDGSHLQHFEADPDHWRIGDDGALRTRSGGGCAWSRRRYGDFVLDLEFLVEKKANSGILLRVDGGNYIENGHEIQVLDSYDNPHMNNGMCGALYDCQMPSENAVKPAGQWNRYLIAFKGPEVDVTLNGRQIIDVNLDDWSETGKNPDGSKNKYRKPVKDKPREGLIGFQDHGDKVAYRNIRIKPLSPSKPVDDKAPEPNLVDGWEVLFDGALTEQLRLDRNAWVVRDGALWFLGRPGPLLTKERFADFTLTFEFRPPRNADGGVMLRCPDTVGHGINSLMIALGDPGNKRCQGKRACGALWGCREPDRAPEIKVQDWNRCMIDVQGSRLHCTINQQPVLDVDLNQWTEKGKNPDGSDNPFGHHAPLKNFPGQGHIAFKGPVDFRNITVLKK